MPDLSQEPSLNTPEAFAEGLGHLRVNLGALGLADDVFLRGVKDRLAVGERPEDSGKDFSGDDLIRKARLLAFIEAGEGVGFRHSSSPVACDSFTVEVHGGRAIPPCSPAVATPSVIETGLGSVRKRTADQPCPLRFGARCKGGFLALAGQRQPSRLLPVERLPADDAGLKINPDHYAARRGLSVHFHAASFAVSAVGVFPNNIQANGVNG